MDVDKRREAIDEYAAQIITYKARQLVGQVGFTESDREDLEQEMMMDLLQRLPKYDPNRARRNSFIARVVNHKIASLIRHRRQAKRDYRRRVCSLDDPIEDKDGGTVNREQTLSQDEHDFRTGRYTSPASEREDMRLDVSLVISQLPPDLQALAELLMTHSITEAARELGLHRDTIHRDRIPRLRKIFEDKGLREYL